MDHLPTISNPALLPVEIEYLSREESLIPRYDNEGFADFPARAGWRKTDLLENTPDLSSQEQSRDVAELVQQWLFFGLLSATMGHRYTMHTLFQDFTRISAESGRTVVTTGQLERYLLEWKESLSPADLQRGSQSMLRVDAILDETQRHVARYMCRGGPESPDHPMRQHPEISLSIMSLGVTMTRAKLRIWPHSRLFGWQRSEMVLLRMTQAGWCPSDISMLEKLMTPSGMYFASLLRPRMARHDHAAAGCNEDFCNVMNITKQAKLEYRPVHRENCDEKCGFYDVTEAELTEILLDQKCRACR